MENTKIISTENQKGRIEKNTTAENLIKSNNPIETSRDAQMNKLPLLKLKPFDKHPFKGYNAEKLQSLAQSIKEQGIIVPILVRPIKHKDFDYEIVAGHNRVQASILAGLDDIPCYVRELDYETATILMIDSNLQQRETILPSEKAFAYKYKLDAIKAQGKRNDLTSTQLALKLQNNDVVGKDNDISGDTVRRYIRLTNLIPQLLDKADERKLSFIPAVELSYLKKQEQKDLFDILSREEKYGLPLKQATLLKGISKNGTLPYKKIDGVITKGIKDKPKNFKVPYKKINDYFPPDTTPKEFEDTIVRALDLWFEKHPKQISKPSEKTR